MSTRLLPVWGLVDGETGALVTYSSHRVRRVIPEMVGVGVDARPAQSRARLPLSVLIVEDSADDADLTIRALAEGGYDPRYERVDTAPTLEAALDGGPWDVIISDYSMPL